MSAIQLAYQVTKYKERNGWSHKDLLRLSHAKATGDVQDVLHYIVKGWDSIGEAIPEKGHLRYLWAVEKAKRATTPQEIVQLITDYNLPRECIPTQFLKNVAVWEALLQKMPLTAMIRNLATMSRIGLLVPFSDASTKIISELRNTERLRKSRVHPIQILSALKTYEAGGQPRSNCYDYYSGRSGSKSQGGAFTPVQPVLQALDDAFYASFGNVEPSGKRLLLGLDTSGSMASGYIAGLPNLTPREATAVMAMVTVRTEPNYHVVNFTTTTKEFPLRKSESLNDVINRMAHQPHGGTDCAQPMLYALSNRLKIDTFVVYTDSETWAGRIHPEEALKQYQAATGINSRLAIVGFTATSFSLAHQGHPGRLDVVGFDTATPALISAFSKGEV